MEEIDSDARTPLPTSRNFAVQHGEEDPERAAWLEEQLRLIEEARNDPGPFSEEEEEALAVVAAHMIYG